MLAEFRPEMIDVDLRLRFPRGSMGVALEGVGSSTTASSFSTRIDSIDPVLSLANGDVETATLAMSCCILAIFSSTTVISWSHCGIVSWRKVNALEMSDMLDRLVVCSVRVVSDGVRARSSSSQCRSVICAR